MNNLSVDNKIILLSALIAIAFHASLIPITSIIKLNKIEEIEPKIILELINDIKEETPVVNNITPPVISQPEKVLKPANIENTKNNNIKPVENTTTPILLSEDIILPDNLKPIINNKIDIPKNVKNIDANLSPDNLPIVNKPEKIKVNEKPIKAIIKPNLNINTETLKPIKLNDNLISQNINLPNKPIKQEVIIDKNVEKLSTNEINTLENYKNNIRSIIQSFAITNYPKKDLRRKNEGIVHIIFKLKEDGSIDSINTGPNTKANDSLINAAIDSVRKSAPFEQISLLKKEREFEINIIYKIN